MRSGALQTSQGEGSVGEGQQAGRVREAKGKGDTVIQWKILGGCDRLRAKVIL